MNEEFLFNLIFNLFSDEDLVNSLRDKKVGGVKNAFEDKRLETEANCIKEIHQLNNTIKDLKCENTELKGKVSLLEAKINDLNGQLGVANNFIRLAGLFKSHVDNLEKFYNIKSALSEDLDEEEYGEPVMYLVEVISLLKDLKIELFPGEKEGKVQSTITSKKVIAAINDKIDELELERNS